MEHPIYSLPPNQEPFQPLPKKRTRRLYYFGIALIGIIGLFYVSTIQRQISIFNPFTNQNGDPYSLPLMTPDPDYAMPEKDSNRLNILILGIRGTDDPDASQGGPLLTDSIQVFSYDKTTKKSSIVSLPRDLYVTIHDRQKGKLNSAYEYGLSHTPKGLDFIKDKVSQITGIYVDQVVVFDFSSFKEIVDALGGIDITLATPFVEPKQWGSGFSLPAGVNHLDGQSALYYARSRYSTSDFDRSRRQQQIMFAIKDKLLQLNFLSDPVKSFSILALIRNEIKTDVAVWNMSELLKMVNQVKFSEMKRSVISTENFLMDSTDNGAYILLPKEGNFTAIKKFFQESLN